MTLVFGSECLCIGIICDWVVFRFWRSTRLVSCLKKQEGLWTRTWFVRSKNYIFITLYKSCRVSFLIHSSLSSSANILIRMLSRPRARTILVDGALREGEPLIPLPSFEILVLLTFSSPSTGVKVSSSIYKTKPWNELVWFWSQAWSLYSLQRRLRHYIPCWRTWLFHQICLLCWLSFWGTLEKLTCKPL